MLPPRRPWPPAICPLTAKPSLRYEKPPAACISDGARKGTRDAALDAYLPRRARQGVQTRRVDNSKP
jgi:hypothetical protein